MATRSRRIRAALRRRRRILTRRVKRAVRKRIRRTVKAVTARRERRRTRRAERRIELRRTLAAAPPQARTLTGRPHPAKNATTPRPTTQTTRTTPTPRAATAPTAAPMQQRVKRTRGGKFNGSVAAKKTANGKKTLAPNPEQQRPLAANKKAAQIDARLARTQQRIDQMFPDQGGQPGQSATASPRRTDKPTAKPRESTTGTTTVTNVNNGGTVGIQGDHVIGETVFVNTARQTPQAKPNKPRPARASSATNTGSNRAIGIQAGHIDGDSAVYVNGKRVQQRPTPAPSDTASPQSCDPARENRP
jgi:hypothetical protein